MRIFMCTNDIPLFMKNRALLLSVLAIILVIQVKAQDVIAVINEPNIVLLDPFDGTIIDPSFIDLTPLNQGLPKSLSQVGEEIWISDQTADRIDRFDLTGSFIGTLDSGFDNIKGLNVIGDEIWVTNAGSNNGAPGTAIIRLDTQGNVLGILPTTGSSFDVIDTGTEVYISFIGNESRIERRDYQGNILGDLVPTGVVTFIQQMVLSTEANTLLTAVFSNNGSNTAGLYEFSRADGTIVDFWQEGSLRGVMPLGNGQILLSAGGNYGVKILDPGSGNTTQLWPESSHYFARLNLSPCATPPTPVGAANQTFEEGATIEDIQVDPTDVFWFASESDALSNTNPLPAGTVLTDNTTYYAIQVVDGCPSLPLAVSITINVLSVSQWAELTLSIAPNPANNRLRFTSDDVVEYYTVFNSIGQIIQEGSPYASEGRIDLSLMTTGMYFIRFTSQDGQLTHPLIVEKD